jgi:aspartate aminotransferase-like enzyme
MEAAIVNTLSPGDRVLVVNIGSFGDRFAKIASAFGAEVDQLGVRWGQAADPTALADRLAAERPYRAVLITHNETSTGVVNPLRDLAAAVRAAPGAPLVVVDGRSGLGAVPFEMAGWGIDLVISASQKAWMASPGIAMAALGPRAWDANAGARMPRFYWDLAEARRWAELGQTPWTPAISVLYGLRVGVGRLLAEGRERTWARHAAIAAGAAAGLEALGLRLVAAPPDRSHTVTAAWLPGGLEWAPFNASMRGRGLVVAGGQGAWAGRILRFGHMGEVGIAEMADALRVMAETMTEFGLPADGGAAAAAAIRTFEGGAA